jgi:hypothetical protein
MDYSKIYEGLKRHQAVNHKDFLFDNLLVRQEFDDYGSHRIVILKPSDWTSYQGIAKLHHKGRVFAGTSEYYSGSLPRVFEVIKPKA